MIKLFKGVGYHMLWDKAGFLSYQFFHLNHKTKMYFDAIEDIITEKGTCTYCQKFIAPYKKLEFMVKLKDFQEGI